MIEAALVFPLLVLMIAGIVSCALYVQDHVRQDAERHRIEAGEYLESSLLRPETLLRLEWVADE
ncbi:MAG: pilus assembly protein [Clostridiales bacterium]|nr:pilus assembly protein [Clostridiales bacterium]